MKHLQWVTLLLLPGCFTSSVDANRGLWQGYLKESRENAERGFAPRALSIAAPQVAAQADEPVGLSILAEEVLGRQIPEQTETTSNRCLFEEPSAPGRGPRALATPDGGSTDMRALALEHVFGNIRVSYAGGRRVVTKSDDGLVPMSLRPLEFTEKYVGALVAEKTAGATDAEVKLSRGEIVDFGREAFRISSDQKEAGKTTVGRLMRMYLSAYLKGKFVDRRGKQYQKPEVVHALGGKGPVIEIGTDAIAGFAAVALEALTDAAFGTPVLKSGDQYFTEGNRIPTFAELFGIVEEVQGDPQAPGITKVELHLIHYVSDLAGTKSRMLSDLVFGLVSNADIQFIVGAEFAFGDNDTLRVLFDTLFEVASRKITEHLAYKALSHFEYTVKGERIVPYGSDNTPLGRVIAALLQEQDLLEKLLPRDGPK